MSDLFLLAGAGVRQRHIRGDLARHDTEEGEAAVLVGDGLEDEGAGRSVRFGSQLVAVGGELRGRVEGRGRVVDDALQEREGAVAGGRGAAEDGREDAGLDAGLDALEELFLGEGLFGEELLHQLVVGLGDGFGQLGAVFLNGGGGGGGDGDFGELRAVGLVGLVLDNVDDAVDLGAVHDGEGDGADGGAELLTELSGDAGEVGVLLVELGDIEHTGELAVDAVLPALFGADGDAGLRGGEDQTGFAHAERLHDFAGEIEEAGGVDEVDLVTLVFYGRERRADRELTADFLGIVVADGVAVGDLAQAVGALRQIEEAFGKGGLAVAAVTEQCDVSDLIRCVPHVHTPLWRNK